MLTKEQAYQTIKELVEHFERDHAEKEIVKYQSINRTPRFVFQLKKRLAQRAQ